MKHSRDPFAHRSARSRLLGVLAAAALACVMLTAISLETSGAPEPMPADGAAPSTAPTGTQAHGG
jgi:hypothetical protein